MIINQTRWKYKIKDQVRDQVYGQVDIKVDDDPLIFIENSV